MTNSFSRIIRDFNKLGGQPYIDQTEITVHQILVESLSGKSAQEIVDHYPQLTTEDIHQALSFAISDIFKGISYWKHDGITPLTQVKGYSEILIGKADFDNLDTIPHEQKQQWLSIIHTSSQRGIARWQQMSHWLSKQYQPQTENDSEVYQLEHFIIDLVTKAQNFEPSLQINVSEISPIDIETHGDTSLILGSILSFAKNTFKPEATIEIHVEPHYIKLSIHRHLLYPDDDIEKLLATPYSSVATATTFFYSQQTPFNVHYNGDAVTFDTQIPIWRET